MFENFGLAVALLGSSTFTPASLFAAGEVGAWYDPSDFSTMFQDSAGTTPVTATGQPVGLILDKSKGLALGSELITNGDNEAALFTGASGVNGAVTRNAAPGGGFAAMQTLSGGLVLHHIAFSSVPANVPVLVSVRMYVPTGSIASAKIFDATDGSWVGATSSVKDAWVTLTAIRPAAKGTAWALGMGDYVTTSADGAVFYVDNISVKALPGNHAFQATAPSRPVLQQDGGSRYYLAFDGVDDSLATGTITPGVDKAQVFAGVRKLSDAAIGSVAEFSANINLNAGGIWVAAPVTVTGPNFYFTSGGSINSAGAVAGPLPAPMTSVLSGLGDISGDSSTIRVNGVQAATSASDQGTGNFGAYPLYIGMRGGSTVPFNGNLYGLIVRFSSANLPAASITSTETWLNSKTGAF